MVQFAIPSSGSEVADSSRGDGGRIKGQPISNQQDSRTRNFRTAIETVSGRMSKKIVIIGGGPTGLGAGYRLHELGYENCVLYEKSGGVGGHVR